METKSESVDCDNIYCCYIFEYRLTGEREVKSRFIGVVLLLATLGSIVYIYI